MMKQSLTIIALLFAVSCSNSVKDSNAALNDKKVALEKLKSEKGKTEDQIKKLQDELTLLDTNAASTSKAKLVSTLAVTTQNFQHFIDLQGKIDADNISYITPRMGPAQVKAVYIKQGQVVKKGQLLLKLDDAIIRHSVAAANQGVATARQGMEGVKTQLNFAKNIYNRQKNLWDQGIGSEVQLITAKNNVDGLEKQLLTMAEQVKGASEQAAISVAQMNTANVYSDVTGVADIVNIRVGEIFSGGPQIKIVNTNSLKVVTNVPENYIGRVHKGSPVEIYIPNGNKKISSSISLISQSVDPTQRGFVTETHIPYDAILKPSQSAVVKILDYAANNAVVIPVNTIQTDESGKYVFVLFKGSSGKAIAHKLNVAVGEVYGDFVEIKTGLRAGDQLVTEGFQNLYEGQLIATVQ